MINPIVLWAKLKHNYYFKGKLVFALKVYFHSVKKLYKLLQVCVKVYCSTVSDTCTTQYTCSTHSAVFAARICNCFIFQHSLFFIGKKT